MDIVDTAFQTRGRGEVYRCVMDQMEQLLIEKALERSSGNQLTAASILGLNRNTLRQKIRKFRIDVGRFRSVANPS
ncbi:MAG: helix-turn-helix domain-containing protein [Candidatus Omnitrophota bacterium]|nr:helix-turn-helix domain-containing protein [Candidatus Omnitrophota bacterium]